MERDVCENDCIFTIFATVCKGFFEPIHLLHAKHTIVRHKPLVSAIQTIRPIHSKCFEIIWIVFSQISVCFISLFLIQSFNWWYFIPIQNNNPVIIQCKYRMKILRYIWPDRNILPWFEWMPSDAIFLNIQQGFELFSFEIIQLMIPNYIYQVLAPSFVQLF